MSSIRNLQQKQLCFKSFKAQFSFHQSKIDHHSKDIVQANGSPKAEGNHKLKNNNNNNSVKEDNNGSQQGKEKRHSRSEWSYNGENGPDNWHRCYPVAASDYQSPINIEHRSLVYDAKLKDIIFKGYNESNPEQKLKLRNDGFAVKLRLEDELTLHIENTPNIYRAFQLIFHWGSENEKGSEHLNDGQSYPMEVQILHRNTKYSVDEMYDKQDGLLLLSIWVEVSEETNEAYKVITDSLEKIKFQDQEININSFPLSTLLPEDTSLYYFYVGSLTTPPCNECASWIVLSDTVKLSQEQLNKFRDLCSSKDDSSLKLVNNFRPPQRLCRRTIKACFKMEEAMDPHGESDDDY